MITSRASAGRGAHIDLDLLCEAVNLAGQTSGDMVVGAVVSALREVFPEIIWTFDHAGRLCGAVHAGYRPRS